MSGFEAPGGSEAEKPARSDRYSWSPLYWAIALTLVNLAPNEFLNFVDIGPTQSPDAIHRLRHSIDLGGVLLLLMVFVPFVLTVITLWFVALVRLRWRRLMSLTCALVAIPLVIIVINRCPVCSPYYWYVLLNQDRFERAVSAASHPGEPAFVRLEERDVSTGLVINPPTFSAIVYDESDEIGLRPAERSADWNARDGSKLASDGAGESMTYSARHLFGHYYLVLSTYRY